MTDAEIEHYAKGLVRLIMSSPIFVEKAEFVTGYQYRHDDHPELIDEIRRRAQAILDVQIQRMRDE